MNKQKCNIKILLGGFLILAVIIIPIVLWLSKKDHYKSSKCHAISHVNPAMFAALKFPKVKGFVYPKNFRNFADFTRHVYFVPVPNELGVLENNFILAANIIVSILMATQDLKQHKYLGVPGFTLLKQLYTPQNLTIDTGKSYKLPPPSATPRLFGVILADNHKNLVIAFRGTQTQTDWKWDTMSCPKKFDDQGNYVAEGFYDAYLAASPEVVKEYVEKYIGMGYNIWVVGHSLGAAVATITSHVLNKLYPNKINTITFGSPRVLNPKLSTEINDEFYRVVNIADFIPPSLPAATSESVYSHTGRLFAYHYNGASSAENHAFYLKELGTGDHKLVTLGLS